MHDVMEVVRDSIHDWVERMMDAAAAAAAAAADDDDDDGTTDTAYGKLFVVVCAGENDAESGTSTHETAEHWSLLLDAVENEVMSRSPPTLPLNVAVVLLGPKLEPWLASDVDSRRCYVRLSRALEARCGGLRRHDRDPSKDGVTVRTHFVDCLSMFCTPETASVNGALMGGRAMPDSTYFENDQLHLSEQGYRVWKNTVEDALLALTNGPLD